MTLYADSKYTIYGLDTLPPALFGETYVIAVGIHMFDDEYKGEYFVLTQRPTPRLYTGNYRFSATGVPNEVLTDDLDFLLQESRQHGKTHLIDRLQELSDSLQKPDLILLQVRLIECKVRPFVGCWLRSAFHDQIRDIAGTTECKVLSDYLTKITSMTPFTRDE